MMGKLSFTSKLLQIFILFGIFYVYAMFQGGFVSWFLFYGFLPLLTYMLLFLFYPISSWSVNRSLSKQLVHTGDEVQVELEIKRKIPFPLFYIVIEEFFPASLQFKGVTNKKYKYLDNPNHLTEKRTLKKVLFPWFKRTLHLNYSLQQIPRGDHQLRAVRIKTGDPFGFIKKNHVYQVDNQLLAYPYHRKVFITNKANSFDEGASPAYAMNMKNTNVVSGVREYAPGDRFSWIDWKTTARKNNLMTKEFEQEKSSNVLLVLDAVDHKDMNKLAFEACVELCTSIMGYLRSKTTPFAFLSLGAEQKYYPPHRDSEGNAWINSFLAKIQPGGDVSFPAQLIEGQSRLPEGMETIIVTTQLTDKLNRTLMQFIQRSKRIVVYVVKAQSEVNLKDKASIQQLAVRGVVVHLITETQLTKQEFEVSM